MSAKNYYNSTRTIPTNNWNLEMVFNFADEYAKAFAKEELQDLLDAGCHSEYLPNKIKDAIYNIDNPLKI